MRNHNGSKYRSALTGTAMLLQAATAAADELSIKVAAAQPQATAAETSKPEVSFNRYNTVVTTATGALDPKTESQIRSNFQKLVPDTRIMGIEVVEKNRTIRAEEKGIQTIQAKLADGGTLTLTSEARPDEGFNKEIQRADANRKIMWFAANDRRSDDIWSGKDMRGQFRQDLDDATANQAAGVGSQTYNTRPTQSPPGSSSSTYTLEDKQKTEINMDPKRQAALVAEIGKIAGGKVNSVLVDEYSREGKLGDRVVIAHLADGKYFRLDLKSNGSAFVQMKQGRNPLGEANNDTPDRKWVGDNALATRASQSLQKIDSIISGKSVTGISPGLSPMST